MIEIHFYNQPSYDILYLSRVGSKHYGCRESDDCNLVYSIEEDNSIFGIMLIGASEYTKDMIENFKEEIPNDLYSALISWMINKELLIN